METLPNLLYKLDENHEFHDPDYKFKPIYDVNMYTEFYKMLKEHIEADCWAMTIDQEILWNTYNEDSMTYKQLLTENNIRTTVSKNPHNLLCHIFRKDRPARIAIYMFESHSWGIIINYENKKFTVNISYESEEVYEYLSSV
jgi:hypothetical protein